MMLWMTDWKLKLFAGLTTLIRRGGLLILFHLGGDKTKQMNQYKPAKLFDKQGDLSKRWYVGYYYLHPESGKYQLFVISILDKLKASYQTCKERKSL